MKANTNEYLGALNILKTKHLNSEIIMSVGIVIASIMVGTTNISIMVINELHVVSLFIGVALIIVGYKQGGKNSKIIQKLKKKYENEEDFSDIIAEL